MQVFKSALAETKLQLSGLIRKLVALIGGVGLGLLALWALAGRQAMSDELVVTGAAAVGSVLLIVLQITFNVALAPYRSIKLRAESAEAALLDLKRSAEFVISFGAMGFNYKYSFHGRVLGFIHVKITNRGPNTCSATVKSVKLNIENKTFSTILVLPSLGKSMDKFKEDIGIIMYDDILSVALNKSLVMGQSVSGYVFFGIDDNDFKSIWATNKFPSLNIVVENAYGEIYQAMIEGDEFGPPAPGIMAFAP